MRAFTSIHSDNETFSVESEWTVATLCAQYRQFFGTTEMGFTKQKINAASTAPNLAM